jgi:recyclin-1
VPVELVSSAATTISSPFQNKPTPSPSPSPDISVDYSAANTPPAEPSTPEIGQEEEKDKKHLSAPPVSVVVEDTDKKSPESDRKRSSSQTGSRPNSVSSAKSDNELNNAMQELDALQHLLSLELCLQLIHINKDAEHRVQRFVKVGFPGRLRTDV